MKYYEYISWASENDHHPTIDTSFTINDTIDKDTSFEIKYANRNTWAIVYSNSSNTGFNSAVSSYGIMSAKYFTEECQNNVSGSGTIKYDKNKYYFDGNLVKTNSVPETSTTGIAINTSRYGDSLNSLDIYYIKIWQDGVLTRHLIPALNDSNEKGMYDIVGNTFYKDAKSTSTLVNEQYLINVTSGGNGTVSGGGLVASGSTVTLSAVPSEKYRFKNWTVSGNVVSTDNPYSFTASENLSIVGNFRKKSNIKLKVSGEWKNGTLYTKVNGTWKEGETYIKNSTWKN